ncbi:MAG: ribosome biogenesis GTPase Der [Clostridia bacterium]|nr:ribosome biogenesis GTPase Der [Clostridia bacterium]
MSKPIVAIVGRPNVGKSTLFNKLSGRRISIVEDTPGVTRDRIYNDIEWCGRQMTLIDTGGIESKTDDMMLVYMRAQAEAAIETADVIIFMVDVTAGLTASDRDVATMLIKSRKPIVLCVNKVDSIGALPMEFYEFYELGIDDPIPVSSVHGTGSGDLLDKVVQLCPEAGDEEEEDTIKVALIGKPNSGKSSLINKILGEKRLIVSPVAGTTRDAVDTLFENEYGRYTFIDTAGIRRQSRISDRIEKFSVLRSKAAVERADVCLILIDASEGITDQDEKIAGIAHESGKASVIVVNKWDAIENKDNKTVKEFNDKIASAFSYMSYAPVIYVSALTGQRVVKLFDLINHVNEQACMRISTGMLNDVMNDSITRVPPPTDRGRRLKIYYATQTGVRPPAFVIFCNDPELFHFSYQRYIENQIREVFGFRGTPITLTIRRRGDD